MMFPPYIRLFVKDFAFDVSGMTDSQLGAYMRKVLTSYKTGIIPDELASDSAFVSINRSKVEYSLICERNKQNRSRSKTSANQWSTSGRQVVDVPLTVTNNHKPITNNQERKKESIYPDANASLSIKADTPIADFEEFWGLYPRKVAKPNALKAYLKSRKKGATHAEIIDGLRKYITSVAGKDPVYIAHGASWINAERWNDVISPQGQSVNGKPAYGDSFANANRIAQDYLREQDQIRSKMY